MVKSITPQSLEFVYEALKDTRDTIRAIDFKANALLVALAIVIASTDKIAQLTYFLNNRSEAWVHVPWTTLAILGSGAWLASLAFTFLVLIGIYNPVPFVKGVGGATGAFYGARAFRMRLWHALWWAPVAADLDSHEAAIPKGEEEIFREVCFEHLKLVYIRDRKALRLKFASWLGFASLVILCMLWALAALHGYGQQQIGS